MVLTEDEKKRRRREAHKKVCQNNPEKYNSDYWTKLHKKVYQNNPEKYNSDYWTNARLKSRYGITLKEKRNIMLQQHNRCAICFQIFNGSEYSSTDHCHIYSRIRMILCGGCNKMLGYARDNPAILANAIDYLNKFEEKFKKLEHVKEV